MSNAFFSVPEPKNEPVLSYAPGTIERQKLQAALETMRAEKSDIPMIIGGREVRTMKTENCVCPHDHAHVLGTYHLADDEVINQAIESALSARKAWAALPWENRASVFLRAAELIAGPYRAKMNAATMLCQSKNAYQSEIDAICELVDFLRFNVKFMEEIYREQPMSSPGMWNRVAYRGLEGFLVAVTPFNFAAIAGNLPSSMAMMGNVVLWKPARTQVYAASILMDIFREAGLPDGVINLVYGNSSGFSKIVFSHPDFAGVHFTGSTEVFQSFWKHIGDNIKNYKTYPRIVGETGGKDFVIAHKSADVEALSTALIRGAFEYQGQKCSAASRAYVPKGMWDKMLPFLKRDMETIKVGPTEDFSNFVNAVIDKNAFDTIVGYIEYAKRAKDAEIVFGGEYDDSKGYFVKPTIILTTDPHFKTMEEEIFGPVLTVYLYDDDDFTGALKLVDTTSVYSLTGAVFANDRSAVQEAFDALEHAAGNFYINDKPTGAVVGQQPFGGARASGTNDKAGSRINLMRWTSVRTIKETFVPPKDYRYPFLG
jgi:1-pyrroline-5-carboxylate dehydrogenase